MLLTTIVIMFLAVMFIAGIFVSIYFVPQEYQTSRFNVFISSMAGLFTILTALNLIMNSISIEAMHSERRAHDTKLAIDKLWLYPNELLVKYKNISQEFLKGFYVNNPYLQNCSNASRCQTVIEEQTISIVMLQAWEDYLTLYRLDSTGARVWLDNFIQWAQNKELEKYFDFLKYNYKVSTIALGELLFEYARQLPIPTTDSSLYLKITERLVNDKRYQEIINHIAKDPSW